MTPSIDWRHFLDNVLPSGITYTRQIIVISPDYQRSLEGIIRSAKPVELQSFFIWMLVRQLSHLIPARYLSPAFPPSVPQERWKYCVGAL